MQTMRDAAERGRERYLCAALLAHVDAGKTTLTEAMLYASGSTRRLGSVDHGDAFLDTDAMERARGVTVFAKEARCTIGDTTWILLDTPGHTDFSAETVRVLQVLDYAILVVSDAESELGRIETLWRLLAAQDLPVFFFVNKTDQPGVDPAAITARLAERLDATLLDFGRQDAAFYETAALCDEAALEEMLETGALCDGTLRRMIRERKLFPVYSGSARRLTNIDAFLQGLDRFAEPVDWPDAFAARVYKISRDPQGNRLTHLRITGGALQVRDEIGQEKVTQLRLYHGEKFRTADTVVAGNVCAVCGLEETASGQGLGAAAAEAPQEQAPILTYGVVPVGETDAHQAYRQLAPLAEEFPEFHLCWQPETRQIQVQLLGEMQRELLQHLARERFGLTIEFARPTIHYRETIADTVEGVGHYEPLRHYAEVHLILRPLPPGSGLVLDTECSEDRLDRNWQNLILTHLQEQAHPGVLIGAPITDLRITLAAGKAHLKHTEGGDFRQATYRAVRHGLRRAESVLLEPYAAYRLELPAALTGRAMSDLQRMAGTAEQPEQLGETAVLTGEIPVAAATEYGAAVTAYTKGRGRFSLTFCGYRPCHNTEEVLAERGYDPDRDVAHPCGSVFCSHGGAVQIPWNEVEDHMDLPACLPSRTGEAGTHGAPARRPVTEAELMAIFRQTYGAGQTARKGYHKSARVVRADGAERTGKRKTGYSDPSAAPMLLVDGYNVIFAWEELHEMAELNLETARDLLRETLQNYQGYTGTPICLIFDAYRKPGGVDTVEQYGDLTVVYTREGETADQYIEKYVMAHGKDQRITVATSDGLEQMMIFGQGALRMPVRELRERILEAEEEIRSRIRALDQNR